MAVLGHSEPVGHGVDTPGDSKVSQCVCFHSILTLPVVKGVQRRCLDIFFSYLVMVHRIWHHGPGWPGMHCPPASASRLARFRTQLTKLPCKPFEFSCLSTVCPLEDAWEPCLDHCLLRLCPPSPRTQSYIFLSPFCSQMSLSSVSLPSPLNPSDLLTGASTHLVFRKGLYFLMTLQGRKLSAGFV